MQHRESVGNLEIFAQGDTFEEAHVNLQDVIEGHVILVLQFGFEIPKIEGVETKEIDCAETEAAQE